MNDVCLSSDSSKYFKIVFFFKQKTAYELRISDWSSDVCSSDLLAQQRRRAAAARSDSEGQRRKARQKDAAPGLVESRSEEHTSELQSLMRTSYAAFCLTKQQQTLNIKAHHHVPKHGNAKHYTPYKTTQLYHLPLLQTSHSKIY